MNPLHPTDQLTLQFDPNLPEQYRTLKECIAARVYLQRGGITAVAGKLDLSPSHLSEVLAGSDRGRKFDLDWLESYVEKYNDLTPILYLVAKFMPNAGAAHTAAMAQFIELAQRLPEVIAQMQPQQRKRAR